MEDENNDRLLYIFYLWWNFFDFSKALTMKKIFQEHETNVDFYSLFVAFDNFVSLLGFPENFHF